MIINGCLKKKELMEPWLISMKISAENLITEPNFCGQTYTQYYTGRVT